MNNFKIQLTNKHLTSLTFYLMTLIQEMETWFMLTASEGVNVIFT